VIKVIIVDNFVYQNTFRKDPSIFCFEYLDDFDGFGSEYQKKLVLISLKVQLIRLKNNFLEIEKGCKIIDSIRVNFVKIYSLKRHQIFWISNIASLENSIRDFHSRDGYNKMSDEAKDELNTIFLFLDEKKEVFQNYLNILESKLIPFKEVGKAISIIIFLITTYILIAKMMQSFGYSLPFSNLTKTW